MMPLKNEKLTFLDWYNEFDNFIAKLESNRKLINEKKSTGFKSFLLKYLNKISEILKQKTLTN